MNDHLGTPLPGSGGCADDAASPTPVPIENPPGLTHLRRRVGTAGSFLAAMQRSAGRTPGLTGLRSRSTDDPTVALMDAWAGVLDILTFYSERIADEGYLSTATEGRSVVELSRAVGYARGPGGAATALLAFTVQDVPGSPRLVPVPAGTQVASLPGPGEVPQTFETAEALDARPEWNSMRARTTGGPPTPDRRGLHLAGLRADLARGDAVLLVSGTSSGASVGTTRGLDAGAPGAWAVRTVGAVTQLPELGLTRVDWADGPTGALEGVPGVRAYRLRLRTGVFGATAPDWRVIPAETKKSFLAGTGLTRTATSATTATALGAPEAAASASARKTIGVVAPAPDGPDDWPGFTVVPKGLVGTVDLDGAHAGVLPGSWVVLERPATTGTVRALYRVGTATVGSRSDFAISGRTTRVTLSGPVDVAATFARAVRTTVVLAESEPLELAAAPRTDPVHGAVVDLDGSVPELPEGRAVVVSGPSPWLRVAPDARDLVVRLPDGATVPVPPGTDLEVVGPGEDVGDRTVWPVELVTATGTVRGTLAAEPGDAAVVPPPAGAPVHVEAAVVGRPEDAHSTMRLRAALAGCYDRAGLRIAANVAAASHGESKVQVLGSGGGSVPFQRFALAQAPLTYVAGVSSLVVRVDGIAWQEVATLHGRGPTDRVFVTHLADDGTVTVLFGDRVTGARLPSGQENVVATYRVGTGLAGHLPAGRLTMLMTYPLGLRSVTNPLPTGLAADPDRPEDVRRHAATDALTMGRVVSVTDFADEARRQAGVGKAVATLGWVQERPVVHVTVAGEAGQAVDDAALAQVRGALRSAGDPRIGVVVDDAETVGFAATVEVVVEPGHDAAVVLAAVRAALLATFGFDARELGRPVAASEVVAAAQRVAGAPAVTLTAFTATEPAATGTTGTTGSTGTTGTNGSAGAGGGGTLPAALPARGGGPQGPAQLRLVDPARLDVTETT